MPTYKIRGIDVDFPYEAYDCQLVYMDSVIQSLQKRCNALLESPTGTGKTLCLLCATLAWRKSLGSFSVGKIERNGERIGSRLDDDDLPSSQSSGKERNLPTIVYTSRTHSQLKQVVQELRRCSYRPKMIVLGSREQLCIHEDVSQLRGKAQNNACRMLCRKREKLHCTHYPRVVDFLKQNPHLGDEPVDIEDLVNIGRQSGPCPYYVSRELHKVVDIMFAPYNYLIDRSYRKTLTIDWHNSILIFDEAHNLESLCSDAASFDLPSGLLTACIAEARSCIDLSAARRDESSDKSQNPDNFAILRALLLKLEKRIAEVPITSRELGFTKPGPYIYELLSDLNITHETSSKLIGIIEAAAMLLEEVKQQNDKGSGCKLEIISNILQLIFREKNNAHANFYRVHVQEVDAKALDTLKGKTSRTLSWWCFNPGVAMEEFSQLGVGSIILTSGTLSPMDSFAQELKLDFPIRLENPHVISSDQIWVGVVPTGPSGYSFNSSYRNRDSLEYKQELGNAIVNFARIVPDGLLVFFPSYYLLDQCVACWKNNNNSHANSATIWERICKHKRPVVEPRQSSLFPLAIEDYMSKLKDESASGAVFFAVCRGKVSEGLDFADHAGRAVVIIGMPFASRTEPKVRLKREYLDQQAPLQLAQHKPMGGEEWYTQQASRAVNQAVGRVIRHRYDYGAIIFCDERFEYSNYQSQVALWIRPHIKCYSKFGEVVFTLSRFFRDGRTRVPTKSKVIENEDTENVREVKSSMPLDKVFLDNFHALPTQTVQSFPKTLSSSSKEAMEDKKLKLLREVLPANRSSLTPFKEKDDFKLKYSSSMLFNEKKLLIPERKNMQSQTNEEVDLTGKSSTLEVTSRDQPLAPCNAKKRKVFREEQYSFMTAQYSQGHASTNQGLQSLNKDLAVDVKGNSEFPGQENKVCHATPTAVSEETKGSAFLIQVKEKLTAGEYTEFIGFMTALKSKTMKIGEVLQSIVRLFSRPERKALLQRFKDYVPAKYRSLYEHVVASNETFNNDIPGSNEVSQR